MRSFWSDPYLWIHLAGIVVVPICLGLCWLGLAVGNPIWPVWLELLLISVVGIAPVLWMQLARPFNIFSVLIFALKPEQLSTEQRKILSLFQTTSQRVLAVLTPIALVAILWQINRAAPMAASITPFPPNWRLAGLALTAIAFLLSNLFLQVPVSVARVLMTSESAFAATEPYPLDKIPRDFTLAGFQVNRIFPLISVQGRQSSS